MIWNTGKDDRRWSYPNGHYHRSKKGGGSWQFRDLPEVWQIGYNAGSKDLTFNLKPFSFKHTGLFPEQAVNWDWMTQKIAAVLRERAGSGQGEASFSVLNLFAYTGGATLACAAAGAKVTHVDASKGMVGWARENAAASGLSDAPIRWLVDDCVKFVKREIRRGHHYDGIIMDPPSYGRGPGGEIWKMEDAIFDLVRLCAQLMDENSIFFLLNSYTTGLQPATMAYLTSMALRDVPAASSASSVPVSDHDAEAGLSHPRAGSRFRVAGGVVTSDEIGLPVTFSGLVLPCGASCRWERA